MNYSLESPLERESLEVRIILLLYFTENPLLSTIMLFVSNHHVFIQEQKTLTLRGLHCQHQNFLTNNRLPWLAVTAAQLWANLMQGFQGTHHSTLFNQWEKKAGLGGEGKNKPLNVPDTLQKICLAWIS